MTDVVGQPGEVDQVGVAAQADRHAAADLGDFERVREPGARRFVLARADDLSLVGQPAERRTVQHSGPVAGEVGAVLGAGAWQRRTLGRLGHQSLAVEVVVEVVARSGHWRTVCQHPSERFRASSRDGSDEAIQSLD